ncbi:MAG: cytochrome d ubiquinol oxidase subunit II, partial [Rhodospirillales bacterium]
MELDLAFIWAGLIAFSILAYVVLDGFDLGVGILFPLLRSEQDRDVAMNSVAPVWDGNETWLVLGGGGLYAVFPLAYATILPALYAPLIAMLIGLIFRGVSFEFRWRTTRGKFLWDWGFAGGSLLATFAQGVTLGALVQGIQVVDRAYAGGWWDWLTPFSIITGLALVVGYMLLGATWLVMKTEGGLRAGARDMAGRAAIVTLLLIGGVSLATPYLNPVYLQRWFTGPTAAFSLIVPSLVMICIW